MAAKPKSKRRTGARSLRAVVRLRRYRVESGVEDPSWHIAHNPTGFDGTLCGIADEGEGLSVEQPSDEKDGTFAGVTCVQCRAIVDFCAALRKQPNGGSELPAPQK